MSLVSELIDNEDTSSISSINTNQSLKEKYERLVLEYSKQKTKLNVVKKAYSELNEASKEKEQSIRKNEQEIESLNFRNKQLVSRISVLQTEVDKLSRQLNLLSNGNNKPTKAAERVHSTPVPVSSLNIMREELEMKINENVELHNKLSDAEALNQKILSDYEKKMSQLLNDKLDLEQTFKAHESSSKKMIETLTNDNKNLEERIKAFELKLKHAAQQQQHLKPEKDEVVVTHFEITDLSNIYNDSLNCLNKLYTFIDERFQLSEDHELIRRFKNNFESLLNLTETSSKSKNSINQYFEAFVDLIHHNQQFINDYLACETSIYQNEKRYISNENKLIAELDGLNLNKKNLLQAFSFNLNELKTLIKNLFVKNNSSVDRKDFDSLLELVKKFCTSFKQLLNLFNDRLTFEHSNYKNLQNLITIDECINSYLIEFFSILDKVKSILAHYSYLLITKWNESTVQSMQNADHYGISKDKLNLMKENERLLKIDLENIKERWNADKILLANAENEIKELRHKLQQQQQQSQEVKVKEETAIEAKETESNSTEETNRIQNEHELSIKEYYENEIINIKYELFLVDGKATFYYQEVEYLNENIKSLIHQLSLENESSLRLKKDVSDLNDELETTRQRYEDQIRTMTEHIALMNDRLTEQAEMIEKLNKTTSNSKGSKKK